MHRFQFSLRTLLLAFVVLSAVIALTLQWWLKPYALTGTYPNGIRAWEQWNRRTLSGGLERTAMIRYYRNGQKAYEYRNGQQLGWSSDGTLITFEEFAKHHWADLLPTPETDPGSTRPWPFHKKETIHPLVAGPAFGLRSQLWIVFVVIILVTAATWISLWPDRKFYRDLATREPLGDAQFFAQFYSDTNVPFDTVRRLRPIYCKFFNMEEGKLRPHDRHPMLAERDMAHLVHDIEDEFGVSISDKDAEAIDGSFDSIVRFLAARTSQVRLSNMFRYRLRTLLILLAVGPPLLAGVWFVYGSIAITALFAVLMILVLLTARPFDLRRENS